MAGALVLPPGRGSTPRRRFEILVRRRQVRAHVGVVLVTLSGDHHGFKPVRQPTLGELLWKGSGTLYEIDMGRHWTRIELELPSRSEAFAFNAVVDVEWWVEEPVLIVKNGVYDVVRRSIPIRGVRSAITRRFEVEQSAEAESMAAASLAELPVGTEYGLVTRAFLRLRMDTPTVQHASAVRDVQHKIELERATQQLRLIREESTAKLIDIRVTRYREDPLSGDYDQFALQLAQNPDEVPRSSRCFATNGTTISARSRISSPACSIPARSTGTRSTTRFARRCAGSSRPPTPC